MTSLQVHILAYGDAQPLVPRLADKNLTLDQINSKRAILTDFSIVEKGTSSGDLSVALGVNLQGGDFVVVEQTGRLFRAMVAAFRGAEARLLKDKISDPIVQQTEYEDTAAEMQVIADRITALEKLPEHNQLFVEAIMFSLMIMKEDPTLSPAEAFERGCQEWDI